MRNPPVASDLSHHMQELQHKYRTPSGYGQIVIYYYGPIGEVSLTGFFSMYFLYVCMYI